MYCFERIALEYIRHAVQVNNGHHGNKYQAVYDCVVNFKTTPYVLQKKRLI